MLQEPTITISLKAAAQLRDGHLWVYSTDILDACASDGDVVAIVDKRRRCFGYGLFSQQSRIAVRWVGPPQCKITESVWRQRLLTASAFRQQVVAHSDAFRLVFGESDLLPSLIIDRYADHFVIQTLTSGMEARKRLWVDLLIDLFAPAAIVERNDAKIRQLEGLPLLSQILYGRLADNLVVTMNRLRFYVDILAGQKTGAFLDQRENYEAARTYARGQALDCFCYTGGFALHLASQCHSVCAIDSSAPALAEARRNAYANGLSNIEFVEANVFDYLRRLKHERRTFDTIVLDPPAFAKSREALEGAVRGYKEINLRAMQLLNPGGTLITCCCSYHLNEELFLGVLHSAAGDAHRKFHLVEKRMQARDHPVLLSMPETYYLKCMILRVL